MAGILFMGAIVNLHFVKNVGVKLGLVGVYTGLFTFTLWIISSARRAELFGSTAALVNSSLWFLFEEILKLITVTRLFLWYLLVGILGLACRGLSSIMIPPVNFVTKYQFVCTYDRERNYSEYYSLSPKLHSILTLFLAFPLAYFYKC